MRTLLIGALAATLAGCSCLAPLQTPLHVAMNECTDENGFACSDWIAPSPQIDPRPAALKIEPVTKKAKTKVAAKTNPSSAHVDGKADLVSKTAKSKIAKKAESQSSAHVGDNDDPILQKAKSTIAAKMEDPSVEFGEMNRAVRKNTLGKPIDTICGYVKAKNASAGNTGERSFLYIVEEDEAYIVDGSRDMMAATAYRNICN